MFPQHHGTNRRRFVEISVGVIAAVSHDGYFLVFRARAGETRFIPGGARPSPAPTQMQRAFRRRFDSLEDVFSFIDQFFARRNLDRRHLPAVSLAAEELFTNMIKYHPDGPNDIVITLSEGDGQLRLSLVDSDVEPFDLTRVGLEPPSGPLEQRGRGGMGIHLVRRMMDSLTCHYADRQSTVTATKTMR